MATARMTFAGQASLSVIWNGNGFDLVDALKDEFGDQWVKCLIAETDLPHDEAVDYEMARRAACEAGEYVPQPRPVLAPYAPPPPPPEWTLPKEPYRRYTDHNAPSLTADESWAPDVPHNYVTGIGDVFDWCDGETKERIRMAIEAEAEADWINDDEIDLGDMRRGPWLSKVFRLRKLRRKVMERAA